MHSVIEHLPQELRDRFTEMREMDLQVHSKDQMLTIFAYFSTHWVSLNTAITNLSIGLSSFKTNPILFWAFLWILNCLNVSHPHPDAMDNLEEQSRTFFGNAKSLKPEQRDLEYEKIKKVYISGERFADQ